MSRVRHELISRLWRGHDPLLDTPASMDPLPASGPATHPYLTDVIAAGAPRLVVDIGAAVGGSALTMASELKARRIDGAVVAVDTFLGHPSDWLSDEAFDKLGYFAGQTNVFGRFVTSVLRSGLGNYILPLTADWATAAAVFGKIGLHPDVVHLGASEDYHAVTAQLHTWWGLLAPGGVLIGRGYDASAEAKRAFDAFFGALGLGPVPHRDGKCAVRKGGGPVVDMPGSVAQIDHASVSPAAPLMVVPEAEAPADEPASDNDPAPRKVTSSFRLGGRPVSVTEGASA